MTIWPGPVSAARWRRASRVKTVREVTRPYPDINAAAGGGYGPFLGCVSAPEIGAMGQHYVKGALVEDPALDKLRPEVLVYEPRRDGGYQLVAVEYVTPAAAWHAAHPGVHFERPVVVDHAQAASIHLAVVGIEDVATRPFVAVGLHVADDDQTQLRFAVALVGAEIADLVGRILLADANPRGGG